MSDHWQQAVEAARAADVQNWNIERVLEQAAPHLERHFREKLAEELRAEARRCDPTHAYPRGPGRWLDAADHLTRKEVME